jgi:hypothetical protein
MSRTSAVVAVWLALAASAVAAGQPPAQQPPRGQMPDLGRPTKNEDTLPLFDFDAYFPGTWTFVWDVPDGPLGPAGRIEGTTVYSALGNGEYQAVTRATGPGGQFTVTERIRYQKEQKTLTREITDSRGFKYSQKGTIGGDLGGFYNIYFESEPVKIGGQSVVFKHALRLSSPLNYRLSATMATDGGPFRNYGTPWFTKEVK